MFFDEERQVLQSHFTSEWKSRKFADIHVFYESLDIGSKKPTEFITFDIIPGAAEQISFGVDVLHRWIGVMQNDVFVMKTSRIARAKRIADEVALIWHRTELKLANNGRILLQTPQLIVLGLVDGRYRLTVSTPFTRDVTITRTGLKVVTQ